MHTHIENSLLYWVDSPLHYTWLWSITSIVPKKMSQFNINNKQKKIFWYNCIKVDYFPSNLLKKFQIKKKKFALFQINWKIKNLPGYILSALNNTQREEKQAFTERHITLYSSFDHPLLSNSKYKRTFHLWIYKWTVVISGGTSFSVAMAAAASPLRIPTLLQLVAVTFFEMPTIWAPRQVMYPA